MVTWTVQTVLLVRQSVPVSANRDPFTVIIAAPDPMISGDIVASSVCSALSNFISLSLLS